MVRRYELEKPPPEKPQKSHFLETWVSRNGDIFFTEGLRKDWMMRRGKGYTFTGRTATVSCYTSIDKEPALNHEVAKVAAIAFMSGNYRRMDVRLGERGY